MSTKSTNRPKSTNKVESRPVAVWVLPGSPMDPSVGLRGVQRLHGRAPGKGGKLHIDGLNHALQVVDALELDGQVIELRVRGTTDAFERLPARSADWRLQPVPESPSNQTRPHA